MLGRDGHALRPLPGLHGVRDRLPVGRAVRQADRGHAAAGRAPAAARSRARAPAAARSSRCSRIPGGCVRWRRCSRRFAAPQRARFVERFPRLRTLAQLAPPNAARDVDAARAARRRAASAAGASALLQGCVQRVFFGDVNAATVAGAGRRGLRGAARPSCRAAAARCSSTPASSERGARSPGDDRGRSSSCDTIVGQRRRLRLGDEGLRPAARATTPSGASARVRSARRCATCTSCWPSTSRRPSAIRCALRVAYHDACHLAHAQGVRAQPRELLRTIPGLELRRAAPSGSSAAARPASTTCSSPRPPPSWARARRATCSPPARRRSPPPTRAARCRSPRTPALPVHHPHDAAGPPRSTGAPFEQRRRRSRPAARVRGPHRRRAGLRRRAARALRAARRELLAARVQRRAAHRRRRDARLPGRDARDPRGRLAGRRRRPPTTATGAWRSPARPTARWSSTR